jgi:hypothetical protein
MSDVRRCWPKRSPNRTYRSRWTSSTAAPSISRFANGCCRDRSWCSRASKARDSVPARPARRLPVYQIFCRSVPSRAARSDRAALARSGQSCLCPHGRRSLPAHLHGRQRHRTRAVPRSPDPAARPARVDHALALAHAGRGCCGCSFDGRQLKGNDGEATHRDPQMTYGR